MRIGHKGLFIDRLDVPVVNSGGMESPRLVPFGHTISHNRNRLCSPQLGRFYQLDPNATAMALLEASIYHGKGVGAIALAFSMEQMYGDGYADIKQLADQVSDCADYVDCLAKCVQDDPERLSNALTATGFNIAKDYITAGPELLAGVIEVTMSMMQVNPDTGELEVDSIGMAEQLSRAGGAHYSALSKKYNDAQQSFFGAVTHWFENGANTPKRSCIQIMRSEAIRRTNNPTCNGDVCDD
ncbi:hypothetical protein [Nodularia spumigena]|uniref:hypothetical protein n=1 Tax=Nodularia spumigena TaxID=70799 RepID=UPI002B21DC68|nr:hypothetical protein [Nodularia spumigena]MEA5556242.1 hypothetical protein [Nodularia spumigena CH309]